MSKSNGEYKVANVEKAVVSATVIGNSENEWTSMDTGILDEAACCSNVIILYALGYVGSSRSLNALKEDVRKHLSYLGWKIEFMNKDVPVFRYTSPGGKTYQSLRHVCLDCLDFGDRTEQRRLRSSNSQVTQQEKIKSCDDDDDDDDDVAKMNDEYCPQPVMDCHSLELGKKDHRRKIGVNARRIAKAKMHSSFMGWAFRYAAKEKRLMKLRYYSAKGRFSYSRLREACRDECGSF